MARKTTNLPEERELKFPVDDLERVRGRLLEIEAERTGPASFEDNWVFDRGDELLRDGCVLRLRTDGQGARVTFKGPRRLEGAVKVRREIEFSVDDVGQARALLEALGYSAVQRYQKKREEWHLGSVAVSLDRTPIGDFVEFEGGKAEVVARRVGFDLKQVEQRSYLRLYADYRREHPEAPPEMTFAEEPAPEPAR